ncbi:diguanylate phosphodiesterase [Terasakiella brassicae]|uniref:Diguanylate phosphodiesterase n=1 Tax=Terasakiella brassicae TaxID=1634917 RepID=A0A917F9B7_9PROT|nr:EAL domain-containing response regulator [Terasakiella brassicae]GGF57314.1 diguanylate phosphodiesterase [Terasakiella brassicae]
MIKKLLVIDDEPDICEFICDVADGMGFSTAKTHKSLDFPLLYSNDLDCIVMDLSMPDMDGIELMRFLGHNQCNADIIVVSGMDESIISTANRLARDHGLNVLGSLSKPIKITSLEDILSRVTLRSIERKAVSSTVKYDKQDQTFPTVEEMRAAIDNKQIQPFFQPQISTHDDTLVACEALARWHHPEKGLVPPFQFISFAEDNNLINDLTLCMFEQVLETLTHWQTCGINIGCSINFSAHSLSNLDLPDLLFAQALKYGISTNFLTIEITENAVLEEGKTYLDVLTRLRMKGFKLSIDDFGTGYSSMKQLRDIPFNEVKIDRSFVMNVMTEESAKSIVQSTTNLAHTLSMSIVSEGVEDLETLNFLKELGSDLLQGYYFSPPLARDDFQQWAHQWQKNKQK